MPMYELKLDPKRRCLEIVLRGYWDEKVMDAFEREETDALEALARLSPPTLCLVDLSQFPPQARNIVDRHTNRLSSPEAKIAARTAVIVPGAIVKMQAHRIIPTDGNERRMFGSRAEAEAWLFGEGDQRAVA
ncbi:MAG TPA: hypothetical protein VJ859_13585 [Allosphingosinicella sp.]|nr:hypothetical protein [Allosphingosinicella sp.]